MDIWKITLYTVVKPLIYVYTLKNQTLYIMPYQKQTITGSLARYLLVYQARTALPESILQDEGHQQYYPATNNKSILQKENTHKMQLINYV